MPFFFCSRQTPDVKTEPIRPARIAFTAEGVPFAPDFDDIYHPHAGALPQAQHVFLGGNGLPERWQGREEFTILETGFGLGNNFLATWAAWRSDPRRPRRLYFISIEKHPLRRDDLARVHHQHPEPVLAAELIAHWPALTPNLHRLSFDGGQVILLLALGDVTAWMPELSAQVDSFYLDGFAPARNPHMWDGRVLKALGRLAAPGATAATWSAARAVREGLARSGFKVESASGLAGKRDMTVAHFEPPFPARKAPAFIGSGRHERRVVIVGAGLAGCSAAYALAAQGFECVLLDRHPAPAQAASGNPAGLFHGIVNADDGTHARFNRSAALHTERLLRALRARHSIAGGFDGLLRVDQSAPEAMQALLDAQGLGPDYLRAVDSDEASSLAGLDLNSSAWHYPGGGWLRPGDYARALLDDSPGAASWRGGIEVAALRRSGRDWELLDAQGARIISAPRVLLANAQDLRRLVPQALVPTSPVRGQLTRLRADIPGLRLPRLPLAGAGYVLPAHEGWTLCGATTQPDDDDPAVRKSDHLHNLQQLARLTGSSIDVDMNELQGRVAWRCVSPDRLPLIGPVPALAVPGNAAGATSPRLDQPRFVPRLEGLYMYTALGSRGITWAALGAELLASWISASPFPVEASLRDATDAARFVSRQARKASA